MDAPGSPFSITRELSPLTARQLVGAVALSTVGGLLLGGLTSFGQTYLPPWVNSVSNSAGGWTMLCFLLVWLGRARPLLGALLGIVAFQALVEGYDIVSSLRGFSTFSPFSSMWNLVGIVAGPLTGASASLTRWGSPKWRALGVTPMAAVLLAEGIWGLIALTEYTSPIYWVIEIVLSVSFLVAGLVSSRPRRSDGVLTVAVWLAGAAAFFAVIIVILG